MTYSEAIAFLYEQLPMFHRIGKAAYKANLDTTIALCSRLDNPEQKFPSIHIAGTNGKGSVSCMIASIMQEAGFKTGLFTSPHLVDFRERIRVNGNMIPEQAVIDFVTKNKSHVIDLNPSFFEWTFALAMDYFHTEKIDIAVVETGMGGRLDSTNTVKSILSIITNISEDHKDFLGDTPEKIAREKAGIIKPWIPLVIGETQFGISGIFRDYARINQSAIIYADRRIKLRQIGTTDLCTGVSYFESVLHGTSHVLKIKTPLSGSYQLKNIRTVLAALIKLRESGFVISDDHISSGLQNVKENTGFKGRWEILGNNPLIIADTAHNTDGLKIIIPQLKQLKAKNYHIVLGMVNDKDIGSILRLFPKNWTYYFCRPDIPRGLDVEILESEAQKAGLHGESYASVSLAFEQAQHQASSVDLIFIGGSTFVVGEFLYFFNHKNKL